MASSSKYRNYYIINEDVLKSGLKGNEMLVYALVRSYVTAGIPFDLTVAKIMERTNIGRRQTIDVLQRLVSKGKLVKVGQEKDGVKSCVYELGSAETAPLGGVKSAPVRKQHQCGNRTCRGAEVAPERCGNSTGRGAETAHVYNNVDNTLDTTFNNTDNNINSLSLSMREGEISKEKKSGGEVVFPAGSVQAKEKKEMDVKIGIIEGWQRHYKDVYGTDYLLTRGSIMQDVADIAPAIETMMENEGKEVTQESVREHCYILFTELLTTADKWQQDRWSLNLITKQFNELLKQRKHGRPDTTKQTGERPRQIADASQFVDRI